jgi:hypothetical protein
MIKKIIIGKLFWFFLQEHQNSYAILKKLRRSKKPLVIGIIFLYSSIKLVVLL